MLQTVYGFDENETWPKPSDECEKSTATGKHKEIIGTSAVTHKGK